jgi:hypothetical protein
VQPGRRESFSPGPEQLVAPAPAAAAGSITPAAIWRSLGALWLALGWLACNGATIRSERSFDQIQRLVAGKTETEVEGLLGPPDIRETRLVDDEVWIWWDYTFLDGNQYAPELRGQAVHLEITFRKPAAGQDLPKAAWRVPGPFSVNFSRRAPRG